MAISPDCPVCLYRCRWLCACLSEILTRGDRCIQFISQLWSSSCSSPFSLSSFSPSPVPPSLLFLSLTLGSPSPLLLSQPPLSPLLLWWTWGSGSVCRESHQPDTPTRLAGSSSHPGGAGSQSGCSLQMKSSTEAALHLLCEEGYFWLAMIQEASPWVLTGDLSPVFGRSQAPQWWQRLAKYEKWCEQKQKPLVIMSFGFLFPRILFS